MPPAKKPTSPSTRPPAAFKEPAALKRLNKSLDSAQEALAELREHTGRDVSQGARDLYKDLRSFVSNARRDTGKLTKALQRDFQQAQKQLAGGTAAQGRSFQARVDQPAESASNGGEAQHRQGRLSNDVGWRPRSVGRDAGVGEQQASIVGE